MGRFDVNDHLVIVGNFGIYQWLCLLLNGMLVCFFGMQMFVSVFSHATPGFRCADSYYGVSNFSAQNLTFDGKCHVENANQSSLVNVQIKCEEFVYDTSMFTSTVVTEFDLVCDQEIYVTVINMAWMASEGVGAVIGSYISDRFGRKPMVIFTYIVMGTFGTIASFSVNLIMYTVLRCTMGFVCFAGFSASVAHLMESTSPDKRSQSLNALDLFWVLGSSSLSLWAYCITNWQYLQLAISILALPTGIACIWLLDESPHWLMSNGKQQQALDVLNKMARWNKVVAPNLTMEASGLLDEDKATEPETSAAVEKESCCSIWINRRVLARFSVFSAGWVSCAFCYYALSFGVSNLPGNLYINSFIMCAVEGLAYTACFSIAYLGRKWPTIGAYQAGGLSLLISIILMLTVPDADVTALSVIGKFFISFAWQAIMVWQTEIYPTTHRCTLTALNGVIGRIGTVLAPYMVDLYKFIDLPNEQVILPAVYVVLMVGVGLLHLIPPETNNRKIPENMREANVVEFELARNEKDLDREQVANELTEC